MGKASEDSQAMGQRSQEAIKTEYKIKSPLIPVEGGYPIILGQGIEAGDLETEYITVRKGPKTYLLPLINPYMMKGAIELVRASNVNSGAEIDDDAELLAAGQ